MVWDGADGGKGRGAREFAALARCVCIAEDFGAMRFILCVCGSRVAFPPFRYILKVAEASRRPGFSVSV